VADLAAAFQAAVVEVLAVKTVAAAAAHGARTVLLAGGVAASVALRERLQAEADGRLPNGTRLLWPRPIYCTDNAAMIASAGHEALARGERAELIDVRARWPLTER
jgi:N6-L-threonylcarbamoyladenine synthase